MVTHLTYSEERYRNPGECIVGIRGDHQQGWALCQVRGAANGPLLAVFRPEEEVSQ
jgi:hypothetical protein